MRPVAVALLMLLILPSVPAVDPPQEDDCGTGGDAGEGRTRAAFLELPVICRGLVWKFNQFDYYGYDAYVGQSIDVVVAFDDASDDGVCTYPPDQRLDSGDWYCDDSSLTRRMNTSGRWTFSLWDSLAEWSDEPVGYTLTARIIDGPQDDCARSDDAGGMPGTAMRLTLLPAMCDSSLRQGDVDWYVVHQEQGDILNVRVESYRSDLEVCLFSPLSSDVPVSCRVVVMPFSAPQAPVRFTEEPSMKIPVSGDWLLRFRRFDAGGDYWFRLTHPEEGCTLCGP